MKLYVGNLSYQVTDSDLRDLFAPFGEPDSARVITDRDSGRSKGFGFVEFSDAAQANAAMAALNGFNSTESMCSRVASSRARFRWLSIPVSPWPGKCFAVTST